MEADAVYFRRRASEERAVAAKARHRNARVAHLQLAARYQDMADGIAAREQYLGLSEALI